MTDPLKCQIEPSYPEGGAPSLAEAMAALPSSTAGIAGFLAGRGLRGHRYAAYSCPLAAYLTSQGLHSPVVGLPSISVLAAGVRVHWQPSGTVADFIRRFDKGEFPELVLDEAEAVTR